MEEKFFLLPDLRKRGYIFEDRHIEGQRREWRLVVESQVIA